MANQTADNFNTMMVDGNAMAGVLYDLFDMEMTTAELECATCGRHGEVGSLWAFMESPGYVLRCPACQEVVLRVAVTPSHVYIDTRGAAYLCIPRRAA